MQKLITALLALLLLIPALAFGQYSQSPQQDDKNAQAQRNESAQDDQIGNGTQPRHTMSGMVSNGGLNLTSNDRVYTLDNPDSLKSHDNQSVTVEFLFNTDRNKIHVTKVNPTQPPQ